MTDAEIAAAERQGDPYIVYTDSRGDQRVLSLLDAWERVTIGRAMSADVPLTWDADASRVHAELVRLADAWVIVDDGLSRNGTFVNSERVTSRRRLLDGDELRIGQTAIRFRAPFQAGDHTMVDAPRP